MSLQGLVFVLLKSSLNHARFQQISTFYGPSVQTMETRLGARQRRRPPTVHRGSTHAPRLQRPVASEDKASACSELRLGCHPETPVIEPCLVWRQSPNKGLPGLGAKRWVLPPHGRSAASGEKKFDLSETVARFGDILKK